jgi:hypothetical protein
MNAITKEIILKDKRENPTNFPNAANNIKNNGGVTSG